MPKYQELTGRRFGKLTALERTGETEDRYAVWLCRCDCGNLCRVNTRRLTRGAAISCGCVPKANVHTGSKSVNMTGTRFGKLTVLCKANNKGGRTAWLCRCDCGSEKVISTHSLRSGQTSSCGCMMHANAAYRDLSGEKIGLLTVLEKTDRRDAKGSVIWRCRCDCGNECFYTEDILMHGTCVSCGCYRQEVIRRRVHERLHRVDGTCVERLLQPKARSDNKSGYVGIHITKNNRYRASIGFQGKRYNLGTYGKLEDALNARRRGEEMHAEFLEKFCVAEGQTKGREDDANDSSR